MLRIFFSVLFGWFISTAAVLAQPTVNLSVTPATVGPGTGADFTISITNPDATAVSDLSFLYVLPAGVTVTAPTTQTCGPTATLTVSGGDTLTYSGGLLAPGGSCRISVPVMSPTVAGTSTFVPLSLSSDAGGPVTSGQTTLTVDGAVASLGLDLSATPSTVNLGERVTLNYTFRTDAAATRLFGAFDFTSALPDGLVLTGDGFTSTCVLPGDQSINIDTSSNTFTLDNATVAPTGVPVLAAGTSCTISVGARAVEVGAHVVSVNAYTALYNAFSTFFFSQSFSGNSATTVTVQGLPADAPTLTKKITPGAQPGGTVQIEYSILNRNRGTDLTDVAFTDTIGGGGLPPLTLSSVSSDTCGGSFGAASGNTITYSGGSVTANAQSCTIIAQYGVPAAAPAGTFSLPTNAVTGQFNGTSVTGNIATDDLILSATQPLFSSQVIGTSSIGGSVTVRFTVQNTSPTETLTNGQFRTLFDDGAAIAAQYTLPATGACGASSGFSVVSVTTDVFAVSATGLELPAGGSCSFDVVQSINNDTAPGTFPVTSSAVSAQVGGTTVAVPSFSTTATLSGGFALTAAQTVSGPVLPGDTATLTTTLTAGSENSGTLNAIGFSQDLDTALSGLTATSVDTNTCGGSVVNNGGTYSYSGGTLAAGSSCDIALTISVPSSATPNTTFDLPTSAITATPASGSTALSFGAATGTLATTSAAVQALDLSVAIIDGPAVPGAALTARYTFTNSDPINAATSGLFTHNLGALPGFAATGGLTDPCGAGSSVSGTNFLIATGLQVPAGGSCVFDVALAYPNTVLSGNVTLPTSSVTASINSTNVTLPPAEMLVPVVVDPLTFTKTLSASVAAPGDSVDVTFQFEANSATGLSNISISQDVTAFIPGASISSIGANTCGAMTSGVGTGLFDFVAGAVAGNGSCSVTFTVDIPGATTPGSFSGSTATGSAAFGAATIDVLPAIGTLEVLPTVSVELSKSFAPATVQSAGTTTVTYTVSNPVGGADLSGFAFADAIGTAIPGASFSGLSTTCAGASVSGTSSLAVTQGSLAAGSSCTITGTVNVPVLAANTFTSATTDLSENGLNVASAASADLSVTPPLPTVITSLSPSTIAQGGTATLTFAISNALSGDTVSAINISQAIGSLSVAATPNVANTCGGTPVLGATPGLSGGSVAPGGSCSLSFDVTSIAVGTQTLSGPSISTSLGAVTANGVTLTVTPAPAPTLAKAFSDLVIEQGTTNTVTLTIDNTAAAILASGLSVTDTLPAGMTVATPANASTTCTAGTLAAVAGANSFAYTGGSVAAGASCTISVDVVQSVTGSLTNTTSTLSSSLGTSPAASANSAANEPPTVSASNAYTAASIQQGQTSTYQVTLASNAAVLDTTGIALLQTFPSGVVVADPANASTTCTSGTATATSGDSTLRLTGGALTAGATCTVSVDVTSVQIGTFPTVPDSFSSAFGIVTGPSTPSATLTVLSAPAPTVTGAIAPNSFVEGASATLTYTLDNSSAAIPATVTTLTDTLPTGLTFASTPTASTTCGGTLSASGATLSLAGGTIPTGGTCTISAPVTSAIADTYNNTIDSLDTPTGVQTAIAATSVTVTDAPAPTLSLAVAPTSVEQGASARLTLGIDNTPALISADLITVDVILPAGVTISPDPDAVTDCGTGTVLPIANGARLVANTLAAGATCSAAVNVIGLTVGGQTISTQNASSSLGASANTNAVLTVTAADIPTFTKVFAPDTLVQGAVSRMTISIDNSSALVPATGGSFSNVLPAGLAYARDPNIVASCSASAGPSQSTAGSASVSGDTLDVSGITVAAGEVCSYAVDVQSLLSGTFANATTVLNTSLGNSGTAAAVLTVTDAPTPTIAASFTPDSVVQGGTSTLTLTIDNSAALVAAQTLAVTLPLPTDMTVAATPNASTTCTGGTLTATGGASAASYSGGFVGAGSTCDISVDVTTTALAASQSVTSSVLQSSIGDTAAGATATLTLQSAPTPGFAKSFSPASILQGDVSTVSYQIDNGSALVGAGNLSFTDSFPSDIVIADTPNVTNTCGATVTATAASSTLTVTGGALAAGASCDISVDVTATSTGTTTSTSGDLTSTLGNSGTAAADLSVGLGPVPTLAVSFSPTSIAQGGTSDISFDITNVASVPISDVAFAVSLPTGLVVSGTPDLSNSCNGTASADAGATSISLSGGDIGLGASCTVTAQVTSATVGTSTATFAATSSQGDSAQVSADLTVTAAPVPTIAATLTPDTVERGDVSVLQMTVGNGSALIDASNVAVSFTLPSAITIAPTPNASTTCGSASITATAEGSAFSLTGGTAPAGGSCTIDVTVRGVQDGTSAITPALTSDLGDSGTASASLTVTPAGIPTMTASFTPTTINEGLESRLVIEIDNSAQFVSAADLDFTATLDAGLRIAQSPNATNSCNGAITFASFGSQITLFGGSVAAAASCTVSVDVVGIAVGTHAANTNDLTSSLGTTPATSATLTVNTAPFPTFFSFFDPPTIPQAGVTNLVFTVDNTLSGLEFDSFGVVVQTPSTVFLAPPATSGLPQNTITNSCGGTISAPAGGTTATLTGGSVSGQSQCSFSVPVTSTSEGTAGAISATLTASDGSSTNVVQPTDPLVVVNNPNGTITFVQNSSADDTFTFTSPTAALNFAIATSGGTGSFGPVDLPGGTYTVTQNRPDGVGNTAVTCSDPDSVAVTATGEVNITLDALESLTCTFNSISTQQETVDQINSFLHRRNNLLLSNGPSASRRMARLNQGIGRTQTLQFGQGDLGALNPLNFDLLSIGSGSYSVATSLNELQRSAHMFRLAFDGEEGNAQRWTPSRWDVWFEASYTRYEASQGSDGHFGIAHLGTDYLVNENMLVGLMLSVDTLDDGDDGGATIEGDGWMFGPYITARLAPNLIFDGRLAYGQSNNTISPFGTYVDEFDTDRLLVDASLSGSYNWDNWVVTPNISFSYIEDRAESYVDSLNVVIPGQTVSLGQIRFGPTFSTTMQGQNHAVIEPSFSINGIYNFGDTDGVVISNDTSNESDGLRARIEAAVRITNRHGARFEFGANYDGIGADDFESYGARLQVSIPLQ